MPLLFVSGFVQSRDVARVLGQLDEMNERETACSVVMKWERDAGRWTYFDLGWIATRMCVRLEPELQVFATGPAGIVLVVTLTSDAEETIDASLNGPDGCGPIRDLRWIGAHLYAAGMSRQVYRREAPGAWVHRDAGTVLPPGVIEVAGFNALDGLDENDIYAVGFNGEIWRYTAGRWQMMDSPTNVVLLRVRVVRPDLVYVSGQRGVLLRGSGNNWEFIDHGSTEADLWGMEWFRDRLYVAGDDGLFQLNDRDGLDLVDTGLGPDYTYCELHANAGILLSTGTRHVAWTDDGAAWHDITPS